MALLPAGFRFSQASLGTAAACARRFYLRYLARVNWPAPGDQAGVAAMEGAARGRLFHHLALQHHLGLAVEGELAAQADPVLADWWRRFRTSPPAELPPGQVFAEVEVWVPLAAWWLRARFDLVHVDASGSIQVLDWKTGQAPPQGYLHTWQTQVYAFVASEGGGVFTGGGPVAPERVSLGYWHVAQPEQTVWYRHDARKHAAARERIAALAAQLAGAEDAGGFAQTADQGLCDRCEYRALCGRGQTPGWDWSMGEDEGEEGEGLVPELDPGD